MAAVGEGREEEKRRADFSSSPCRHNQQNMAVLCRHVVTSMARGGNIWGEWGFFLSLSLFLRPVCHTSAARGWGGHRRPRQASSPRRVRSDASAAAFECNFSSPALFIDFDLRDSDVGVPPRRLLPSETAAPGCYADAELEQKS